jgi:hypothetical protein
LRPSSSRACVRAAREAFARVRTSPESADDDYSSRAVPSVESWRSPLRLGVSPEGLASATFGSRGRFHAARLRSHSRASTSVRSTATRSPLKRNLLPTRAQTWRDPLRAQRREERAVWSQRTNAAWLAHSARRIVLHVRSRHARARSRAASPQAANDVSPRRSKRRVPLGYSES